MKTLYNLPQTDDDQIDGENNFHFNMDEDVRKSLSSLKSVAIDVGLLAAGFIAIIWIFRLVAG